jgi:HEAT repeat protein
MFVFVQERVRQHNGDVKAPWLLKQAVETVIFLTPESGTRHLGWCGVPMMAHIMAFQAIFRTAPTDEVIPFLEHRAMYVREAVRMTLSKRGDSVLPAIERAREKGSARIKLELIPYDNAEVMDEKRVEWLNEIIENRKFKVFQTDGIHISRIRNKYKPKHVDDYPIDIVKFYLKMMETDFIPDKIYAIECLGRLGEGAAKAVPALIKILKEEADKDPHYPGGSISRFGEEYSLHDVVITALGNIGPPASEAIPLLEAKLPDSNYSDQINIRTSLYLIGSNKKEHLAFLMNELNTQSSTENLNLIMRHITRIGQSASGAMPRLIDLAKTGELQLRRTAIWAIRSVEDSDTTAKKLLIEGMEHEDPRYREETVSILTSMRRDPEIKAVLFNALDDIDPNVKYAALKDLYSYGREREAILPAIIEVINAVPRAVHAQDAADMLRNFPDSDFSDALPGLLNLLVDNQDHKIKSNIKLILSTGCSHDDIVKKLMETASSEDKEIRISAIETLGNLKSKAVDSLPTLYKAYQSHDRNINRSAQTAIRSIVRSIDFNTAVSPNILISILDSLDDVLMKKAINKAIHDGADIENIARKLGKIARYKSFIIGNEAMKILETLGDKAVVALPALASMLDGKQHYQSNISVRKILESVTSESDVSPDDILPVLFTKDRKTSLSAAKAIIGMNGDYDSVVKKLTVVTKIGSRDQIKTAIKVMGDLGGGAGSALPLLKEFAKSDDSMFYYDARRAIARIMKSEQAIEGISIEGMLGVLEVGTDRNKIAAANKIIESTGKFEVVINRLGELAVSDDEKLAEHAMWALGDLETHQSEALLKLHEIHKLDFNNRRHFAGYQTKTMLQRVTPESDISVDVILKVIESPNQEVVRHGSEAVIILTGDYDRLVTRLIELLDNDNDFVRANACFVLARLKGHASDALPKLNTLENTDNEGFNLSLKYAKDEINRANRKK